MDNATMRFEPVAGSLIWIVQDPEVDDWGKKIRETEDCSSLLYKENGVGWQGSIMVKASRGEKAVLSYWLEVWSRGWWMRLY